jgi:2-polyprenyl-3-methyl-5-hydroxy-6-metoxy-1,4-benzoquinol methylase
MKFADYKVEKNCRLCSKKKLHNLINFGNQPLANRLNNKIPKKELKFPLNLCMCKNCKTIQIKETVNPKILFEQYFWQTSTSVAAKNFSKIFCKKMLTYLKCKKPFVLEIASNDGTFLLPFKKKGLEVLGVDPAKNLASISIKNKIPVLTGFFNNKTVKKIIKIKKKKADLVFARNVIAHVKNIHEIVESAHEVLSDNGIFAVEFHHAKKILEGLQYDSVYHEHLFYFNLLTLKNFFSKKNLYLCHAFKSPISGGAIVALFSKSRINLSVTAKKILLEEIKNKANSLSKWKEFSKNTQLHKISFLEGIKKYLYKKKSIIAYGASARSSTFLNYSNINNKNIKFIIDKNPLKINKYTPGTNLKIISFNQFKKKINKFNTLLLLAWNFKKEIIQDLKKFGFKGFVLTPFPKKINCLEI